MATYCGDGMGGSVWTDDGIVLLRKLWAEGATAAVIGRRLGGFSRSAVLGKVFRLRLNGEASATAQRAGAPVRRRSRQPRKRLLAPPPKPAGRFTLFELTNESCRWPSGEAGKFFFCGVGEADVANGIPYCPRHMRRAYNESVSFVKSARGDFRPDLTSASVGERA